MTDLDQTVVGQHGPPRHKDVLDDVRVTRQVGTSAGMSAKVPRCNAKFTYGRWYPSASHRHTGRVAGRNDGQNQSRETHEHERQGLKAHRTPPGRARVHAEATDEE